jgi:hypothetical protein
MLLCTGTVNVDLTSLSAGNKGLVQDEASEWREYHLQRCSRKVRRREVQGEGRGM